MDELVKKISSYNILNYLIPGAIGAFFIDRTTEFQLNLIQESIFIGFFVYYFIGSIASRVGSLLESLATKFGVLDFFGIKKAEYKDFIRADKIDSKIQIISEINNMYRTFFSLFLILSILSIYEFKATFFFDIALCFIYFFSYKKQTSYFEKRVAIVLEEKE